MTQSPWGTRTKSPIRTLWSTIKNGSSSFQGPAHRWVGREHASCRQSIVVRGPGSQEGRAVRYRAVPFQRGRCSGSEGGARSSVIYCGESVHHQVPHNDDRFKTRVRRERRQCWRAPDHVKEVPRASPRQPSRLRRLLDRVIHPAGRIGALPRFNRFTPPRFPCGSCFGTPLLEALARRLGCGCRGRLGSGAVVGSRRCR